MTINNYLDDSHLFTISYEVINDDDEIDDVTQYATIWAFTQEDAQRRFREIRPFARCVQAS